MIGVAVSPAELETVEEFFELFKTPWEVALPKKSYRVVLGTDEQAQDVNAEVLLLYGVGETSVDRGAGVSVMPASGPTRLAWEASTFAVSAGHSTFDTDVGASVLRADGQRAVDYQLKAGTKTVRRIGYDLFREVRCLLTTGQSTSEAPTPTLELHIALLRHFLKEHNVPFVEIPPRPEGYDFVCCLTHDVDFFGIRRHKFDRTLAGFVARASVGTLYDAIRGRRSATEVTGNWRALLSLPFVFLGLAPDPWQPFEDYARVEGGRRSTFFLVPCKGEPGAAPDGAVDPRRAAPYEINEVRDHLHDASARGHELAVHGIDAWRDVDAGRTELTELTKVTDQKTAGVRMHWLYFDEHSAERLEQAGFGYDSTWGYNDAVGFRAGTSQVFRLPGTHNLMELPLSIMDSALFYRGRMGLSRDEALGLCRRIVANARRFGGTVVLNWHGRSLAPERLWGRSYVDLLAEIEAGGRVWFATADETVQWFRWRRSIHFTEEERNGSGVAVSIEAARPGNPGATVLTHLPNSMCNGGVEAHSFDGQHELRLCLD